MENLELNYLERFDELMHEWFGSLSFSELEYMFNVRLFGLNEDDTEDMLNLLRDEWYDTDLYPRELKIELFLEYYRNN